MRRKILIVEDQPDIRTLIRMTLDFGDYELHGRWCTINKFLYNKCLASGISA
jgi:hypothetical protein